MTAMSVKYLKDPCNLNLIKCIKMVLKKMLKSIENFL